MKNVKSPVVVSTMLCLSLLSHKVKSQENNHHKNYIDIGVVGGVQHHNSAIAGVYGSIGTSFMAFHRPSSIDIRVKEAYISNPDQQGTLITFTYRTGLVKGLFAGIGGAHGHQVLMDEFLIHPTSSIGGTNTHILHSTGFNVELGYNFSSFLRNRYVGIYPNLLLSYTQLFMTNHSMPTLTFSGGIKVGLKQWN